MTTLYSTETYEPLCEVSQAAADLAIARNPGKFFYFEDAIDPDIANYLNDPDFLKPGGTG